MSIKMPIKFLGSYKVITRQGGTEKQEICQKLSVSLLSGQAQSSGENSPTHLITYFCFGCRRVLEGRITEDQEDRVVFQSENREFEFSPATRPC